MLTLNQSRLVEFKTRKGALIRGLNPTVPQDVATFVRQYRDLILEYADVLPSAYGTWAKASHSAEYRRRTPRPVPRPPVTSRKPAES